MASSVHPSGGKLRVTILASEWGSSKGGLSTINRELAIQLAKWPEVEITFFLPQCSEEDKNAALSHNIKIVKAARRAGYEELDWLSFPPDDLQIDVIVGHGVKLGRQAQVIRELHKCKWIQVVHTDPEELGMFKSYENPISKGENKHKLEVELCEMADFVVGVGPKLSEAFRSYLRWCKKDQTILNITPGVFTEFLDVKHAAEERKRCGVLVFGRGDAEDFQLKGFDIAGKAVAQLDDAHLYFVGAPEGKHEDIANRLLECGIPAHRLTVRGFLQSREELKRLFCEVDLVLVPSRTEGFGLTGLEALSAGLPVLVTKNSGFGEALHEVPFGSSCVIDSEDAKVWAEAIKKIWNKDRGTRLQEAEVLRASYEKKYSWEKQSQDLVTKMISITNGSEGSSRTKDGMPVLSTNQGTQRMTGEQNADISLGSSHTIQRVRQLYKTREERLLPVPWCDDFSFHVNDIFTRLRIVNKDKTRGTLTEDITNMTAIFRAHKGCQKPRTVLIEGDPGMGKTTYCQKLAYDWATRQEKWDESFPETDLLLLLRCHDIKFNIWEAIDEQILPDDLDDESKEKFFKFVRENQSKVLLVLDGLDEADPSQLAMYIKLAESRELPNCHIVFTSRHETGKKVRRYCDTLWEIVGFTEDDARNFIVKYFKDMEHLADELLEELSFWFGSKDLRELTSNPLNTALLCVLYEDFEGDFPTSRTQLYIEIVLCVLRRYEKKKNLSSNNEDLIEVYKEELITLGRMALETLIEGDFYIEGSKLGGQALSVLTEFGFLSVQAVGSRRKPCVRYGFLHKSFQEFFAGFYLASQILSEDFDLESVVTEKRKLTELKHVFLFMSGILVSKCEETAECLVKSIVAHINWLGPCTPDSEHEINSNVNLAFDCIEECVNYKEDLRSRLLTTFGSLLDLQTLELHDGLDSPYIEYFSKALAVNTSLTSLRLIGNGIGDYGASLISDALTMNTTLTTLDLSGNTIGPTGAGSLSNALTVNTTLTNLNVNRNAIRNSGADFLFQALKVNTALTILNLGWTWIDDSCVDSLSEALTVNATLTDLDLCGNRLGYPAAADSLSKALKVNTALTKLGLFYCHIFPPAAASISEALTVNNNITHLNLGRSRIGNSGAGSLSEALKVNTALTDLNLMNSEIGDIAAGSLSKALTVNTTLTHLNLHLNCIGDSGAGSLSKALAVNTTLTHLNLNVNRIGDSGAGSLSKALTVNTALTDLNLGNSKIGDSGAGSLSEALTVNTTLTHLNLSANNIGDSGAGSLSKVLAVNTTLTHLNLSANNIGDSGAGSLSKALAVNTTLTHLDLNENNIGDCSAGSLSKALSVNSPLTNLNLSKNRIGDSGASSLSEALKGKTKLTHLNLGGNGIGDSGAGSLSKALTVNTTLTHLNLYVNKIGVSGAHSLSEALRVNAKLTHLDLRANEIGDSGADSLCKALTVNTTLTHLNLSENKIDNVGAGSLSKPLTGNKTSFYLNLSRKGFCVFGRVSFRDAPYVNTTCTVEFGRI